MTVSSKSERTEFENLFAERVARLREHISTIQGRIGDAITDDETFEELSMTLEELEVAEEELILQNEELRQTRAGLELERARYQDLFEFAPDAYVVTDASGAVQRANRAAGGLFGVASQFLPHKLLISYLHDEERKGFRRKLAALTSGETPEPWEMRLKTHHGNADLVAEVKVAVDGHADETSLLWSFRDISERKEMEKALRRSQLRFRQAFRVGPVAAIITSLEDERLLEVNSAFERLTGYEADEALGCEAAELGLWASAEDHAAMDRAKDDRGAYRDLELHISTKRGKVRDILSSTEVIVMNGDSGMLHMFYDITERKQSEGELMHAINTVMQDTAWFSRSVVEKLTQLQAGEMDPEMVAELTKRERQVLERVAKGHSNEMISDDLGIAKQTVRNYVTRVYEKLGVHTRAEAVVWARERGLSG